jgi:hypothetical protein
MRKNSRNGKVESEIWQRVTQFGKLPSPTAARGLLTLQFSEEDRNRMRDLSAKARAGTLTADEEREADAYESLGSLLGILHSQARRTLKRHRTAS